MLLTVQLCRAFSMLRTQQLLFGKRAAWKNNTNVTLRCELLQTNEYSNFDLIIKMFLSFHWWVFDRTHQACYNFQTCGRDVNSSVDSLHSQSSRSIQVLSVIHKICNDGFFCVAPKKWEYFPADWLLIQIKNVHEYRIKFIRLITVSSYTFKFEKLQKCQIYLP